MDEAVTTRYVDVFFCGRRTCRTPAITQTDYGRIYRFCDLSLPSTFEMHFANSQTGTSKRVLGSNGEAEIPDEYLVGGQNIYAFIFLHETPNDGETRYTIISPVTAKGPVEDSQPTPVQQDTITQAIAALNAGVETVQEIAEGIPQTIEDALAEAKQSGEFDGADGVSPTVTVTPIIGGHQVMITDADGEHTFDVTDGEDGLNGDPGADGFSPIATVTQTQTGAVISVTDKQGTTTATVTNGAKGDPGNPGTPGTDGFSPVATVTQTQTGATISITDKTGTTTAQISNGAKGDPGDDYVLTSADKTEIAQLAAAKVDVPTVATTSQVKAGTDSEHFLAPSVQDNAVFYALAKAAGADMALSSNPVGTYTDAAKIAIQKMLGIYEAPWELIREDTVTNATEADINITADGNGESFELTDVYLQVWTPQQETDASIGDYGTVRNYYSDSGFITSQMQTWNQASGGSAKYGQVLLKNENGAVINVVTQNNSQYALVALTGRTNMIAGDSLIIIGTYTFKKTVIKKVTGTLKYKLYGRRKWN